MKIKTDLKPPNFSKYLWWIVIVGLLLRKCTITHTSSDDVIRTYKFENLFKKGVPFYKKTLPKETANKYILTLYK